MTNILTEVQNNRKEKSITEAGDKARRQERWPFILYAGIHALGTRKSASCSETLKPLRNCCFCYSRLDPESKKLLPVLDSRLRGNDKPVWFIWFFKGFHSLQYRQQIPGTTKTGVHHDKDIIDLVERIKSNVKI